MRRLGFASALLLVIAIGAANDISAAPRNPVEPIDKRSGFYDFETFQETLPSGTSGPGLGTISGVVCTVGTATQPADFAGNHLHNCDTTGPHNETTIAVNPTDADNIIAGSHGFQLEQTGATAIFRIVAVAYVSKDGGTTWTNVHPPLGSYQFTGDPVMAFDAGGRAYYFNIADHEGPGGPFTAPSVIAQRSDDGGITWTKPVTVAKGHGAISFGTTTQVVFQDKEWGTADANPASPFENNVYVTWTRFLFLNNRYIESPIFFSRSTDGGRTWSEGVEISGSSATLCSAQIDARGGATRCDEDQFSQPVVAPNGDIYVSFLNEQRVGDGKFKDQALVVKSTDGGLNWSDPVAATPVLNDGVGDYPLNSDGRQRLTGCQYRVHVAGALAISPAGAPNAGQVYYVFVENKNAGSEPTQTDVMVVTSTNGGATWSTPVTVNANAKDQMYPWAAVRANGRLVVGYMDHNRTLPATDPTPAANRSCVFGYTLSTAKNTGATSFSHQSVESKPSVASFSRWFGINTRFLGDYTNVAIGPDGTTWANWTDQRQLTTVFGITRKDQDAVAASVP